MIHHVPGTKIFAYENRHPGRLPARLAAGSVRSLCIHGEGEVLRGSIGEGGAEEVIVALGDLDAVRIGWDAQSQVIGPQLPQALTRSASEIGGESDLTRFDGPGLLFALFDHRPPDHLAGVYTTESRYVSAYLGALGVTPSTPGPGPGAADGGAER